jgi:hypothetical protein
MKKKNLRIKTL